MDGTSPMEVYSWENHLRDLSASHVGLPEGMPVCIILPKELGVQIRCLSELTVVSSFRRSISTDRCNGAAAGSTKLTVAIQGFAW